MGVNNNICTALNSLYGNILAFIDEYEFNEEQAKHLKILKSNLELALPMGKYTTSKLEDFKRKDDPTYKNQSDFFEKDMDYIEEMVVEADNLKKNYKNYKAEEINEKDFFKEKTGYNKYQLVKNYEEAYNIALLLNDTLDINQKKKFEQVLKRIIHCYYMAYRMCRKLNDYCEKYPFDGDEGKFWVKDKKVGLLVKGAKRFKKINEERFKNKKNG